MDGHTDRQNARGRSREADAHGNALHDRVVGQNEAVTAVSNAVRRARAD